MRIEKLSLFSFRNLEDGEISFSPGINFLLGDNAQGKTNVLEAIYLFARGKSFRGAPDGEMIRFGGGAFREELTYRTGERRESLSYAFSGRERVRRRNGVSLTRQSEMIGHFKAVLFCPDDLQLVKGAPSLRRRFMDVAIAQCFPVYIDLYSRYNRYLEERNSLLRMGQKGNREQHLTEQLAVYSEGLALYAAKIWEYRQKYAGSLAEKAKDILFSLSGGREELCVSYRTDIGEEKTVKEAEEIYRRLFTEGVEREFAAGTTLHGIHRDDLTFSINGKNARDFASQGQQRSAVLACKLAEGKISAALGGEEPVYLFDDVLSELDDSRKAFLLTGLKDVQLIVTGCDKKMLGKEEGLSQSVHFLSVRGGEVRPPDQTEESEEKNEKK